MSEFNDTCVPFEFSFVCSHDVSGFSEESLRLIALRLSEFGQLAKWDSSIMSEYIEILKGKLPKSSFDFEVISSGCNSFNPHDYCCSVETFSDVKPDFILPSLPE